MNPIFQEFNTLNKDIRERYELSEKMLHVYTPFDSRPMVFCQEAHNEWESTNLCRAASQILTGIEVVQIMTILEAVKGRRQFIGFLFPCIMMALLYWPTAPSSQ
jgi:hypothetical protein